MLEYLKQDIFSFADQAWGGVVYWALVWIVGVLLAVRTYQVEVLTTETGILTVAFLLLALLFGQFKIDEDLFGDILVIPWHQLGDKFKLERIGLRK